jgi:3-oxoacyl-[acyl-carrier protein] reductase
MDLISGLRAQAKEEHRALHPDLTAAFSLDGRTAVVTGSGGGLGRQAAITYAQAGANVVLADLKEEGLAETAAMVEGLGAKAVVVPTDVSVKDRVDDLARQALRETGRVDVWANVAGIILNSLIVETTEEQLDAVIGVNLKGVYWGTAAAGRVMSAAKRGAIVNIASAGGETAAPTLSVYGLTKAGVIQLTRAAAAELGPYGVRANSVAPGYVETPMTRRVWVDTEGTVDEQKRAETLAAMSSRQVLAVNGEPSDIAYAMLYLAVDASKFMTGQVLRPNGGVHMA